MPTPTEVYNSVIAALREVSGTTQPILPLDVLAGAKLRIVSPQQSQTVAGLLVKDYPTLKLTGPEVTASKIVATLAEVVMQKLGVNPLDPSITSLLAPHVNRMGSLIGNKLRLPLTKNEIHGLTENIYRHLGTIIGTRNKKKLPRAAVDPASLLLGHIVAGKKGNKNRKT